MDANVLSHVAAAPHSLGARVAKWVYKFMKIDDEWSLRRPGEFTWWPHFLAQRVWCEAVEVEGADEACRAHVSTDLLKGFKASPEKLQRLFALQPLVAPLASFVRDGDRIRLEAAVTITDETEEEKQKLVAWIAAITAATAHTNAELLASVTGSRVDRSAHPETGKRKEEDGLLEILHRPVGFVGREESRYCGEAIAATRELLEPLSLMIPGQTDEGLSAEFPFRSATSLLRLTTEVWDTRLGNGVLMSLSLPEGDDSARSAKLALELNAEESMALMPFDQIGGWIPHAAGLTHVAFIPNALSNTARLDEIAAQHRARSEWVSALDVEFPSRRLPQVDSPEEALEILTVPGYVTYGPRLVHKPWWRVFETLPLGEPLKIPEDDLCGRDGRMLVSWGIFNPMGPTVSSLVYLPFDRGERGLVAYSMLNPFGRCTYAIDVIDGGESFADEAVRVATDLFSRNVVDRKRGASLILDGCAPTYVYPHSGEPSFDSAVPVFLALNPALAKCDLECGGAIEEEEPWDEATEELRSAVKAHERHHMTVVREGGDGDEFSRWYARVSRPARVKAQLAAIIEAWSGSIGFAQSLGESGAMLADDAYGTERLVSFLEQFGFGE